MPAPVLQIKRGAAANIGIASLRAGEPGFTTDKHDFYIGLDAIAANQKFFGSARYWKREDATNAAQLKLVDKDGTNYVAIKAPDSLAGIVTYRLPGTQGGNNTVLTNDGSGGLSWGSGSNNATFTGISTFSDTTDNTLGDPDTGAVQIDGGLGVNMNVTVGAGLSVIGQSHFIGTATFYGGTINLGDSDTDDIVFGGEIKSNLIPTDDATYNLGTGAKRWNNASFAGVGTFATGAVVDAVRIGITSAGTIDTTAGNLILHSATGTVEVADQLNIIGDLDVTGNVFIGGTTVTLRGEEVFIENKDIVLGYTTSITPNDNTANHAGVAIASTEGSPLVSFTASGINTLPDTYKQMMWFKDGTLGFATDAFAFNYAVAIGTTTMADGIRLAVGSGITMSDTGISATNFYGTFNGSITGNAPYADNAGISTQVKTVTASDNPATYYLTFVDANNGSATAETVYTDDGIYYNPGTNTFTTQHASFTGNINVAGITTLAGNINLGDASGDVITAKGTATFEQTIIGTATTANRAGSVDVVGVATNQNYYITLVDGSGNAKSVGVDAELLYNPNTNTLTVGTGVGITQFSGSVSTGTSTSSVPTSSAVINYVGTEIGNIDLTLGINADTGGPSTVTTSQTLTINGTASEVETSVSGQTVTIGLPNAVVVGTSLSAPTLRTGTIQSSNTGATALTLVASDVTVGNDLTVQGNLYVQGSTTQIDTTTIAIEDRTLELGRITSGTQPTSTTWDLAVLFNYGDSGAKKAGLVWEASGATKRFQFTTDVDPGTDGSDSQTNLPVLSVTNFAPIEIAELWVNNSCTGGAQQVIGCVNSELQLQNIVVDAGTF